jgi:hypothetical protein
MLPFENAKLLPKSKVFEEQVAARAKEASGHDRQKSQQEQHETSFARVHAKAGTQPTYLIRQQIAILASHNHKWLPETVPRRLTGKRWLCGNGCRGQALIKRRRATGKIRYRENEGPWCHP